MDNYRILVETIRLIAAPPEIQLSKFPEQVCRPDEVAFTLEELFPRANHLLKHQLITNDIYQSLQSIDTCFSTFSSLDWTEEAMFVSAKWHQTRQMALALLLKMGEKWQSPNLFWIEDIF
ncbi:MAG: hypothetical protein IJ333_08750 [Clostridia bacterium]|nr:hypothetical protein [Clostridia bacterium]